MSDGEKHMASKTKALALRIAVGLVVVIAAVTGGYVLCRAWFDKPAPAPLPLPFSESAAEAGLTWQMRFLPGEQGEKFKINLYDHGAGLAVGDYDGDSREDVYFCNQLGPN